MIQHSHRTEFNSKLNSWYQRVVKYRIHIEVVVFGWTVVGIAVVVWSSISVDPDSGIRIVDIIS